LKGTFCRIDSLLKNQDDSKSLKGDAIGRERANCSLNTPKSDVRRRVRRTKVAGKADMTFLKQGRADLVNQHSDNKRHWAFPGCVGLKAAWLNYELKKLWDEVVLTVIGESQR